MGQNLFSPIHRRASVTSVTIPAGLLPAAAGPVVAPACLIPPIPSRAESGSLQAVVIRAYTLIEDKKVVLSCFVVSCWCNAAYRRPDEPWIIRERRTLDAGIDETQRTRTPVEALA